MNAADFSALLDRVAKHERQPTRVEVEGVIADCARIRDAIEIFGARCSLGASESEVAGLLLVLDGAPFCGAAALAHSRKINRRMEKGAIK